MTREIYTLYVGRDDVVTGKSGMLSRNSTTVAPVSTNLTFEAISGSGLLSDAWSFSPSPSIIVASF
jgi:hypothetical protein